MKKSVIIIILGIYLVSFFLVGLYGTNIFIINEPLRVYSAEFIVTDKDGNQIEKLETLSKNKQLVYSVPYDSFNEATISFVAYGRDNDVMPNYSVISYLNNVEINKVDSNSKSTLTNESVGTYKLLTTSKDKIDISFVFPETNVEYKVSFIFTKTYDDDYFKR